MKQCVLTMSFDISEEDYKSEKFQEFKNDILNNISQKEFETNNHKLKNVKINLTTIK